MNKNVMRKNIYANSIHKIGIRCNNNIFIEYIQTYCLNTILPMITKQIEVYGEYVKPNENFSEYLSMSINNGYKATITAQQIFLSNILLSEFELPVFEITPDNIWVDDELETQLLYELYDCGNTMVVIDIKQKTVNIL